MTSETIVYPGECTITAKKQLEVMKWILDPTSRPYESANNIGPIIAKSAGGVSTSKSAIEDKSTVQKLLEVQRMIVKE